MLKPVAKRTSSAGLFLGDCIGCNHTNLRQGRNTYGRAPFEGHPCYYFDLHNDLDALDPEGRQLPSLDAAKADAVREAHTMMQVSVEETGRIDLRHHIDVRDEYGAIVYVLHFEDAVTVQRGNQTLSQPSVSPA
jgi:hypothetical protein